MILDSFALTLFVTLERILHCHKAPRPLTHPRGHRYNSPIINPNAGPNPQSASPTSAHPNNTEPCDDRL